jgi:hypothetical protein
VKAQKDKRIWRSALVVLITVAAISALLLKYGQSPQGSVPVLPTGQSATLAIEALSRLDVRAAASKSGYSRKKYSDGWAKVDTCSMRDKILARDMTDVRYRSPTDCTVVSGVLRDPYTGKTIYFHRGPGTSTMVQIDHVVAVSNAWQTGAQKLTKSQREQLYNDSLELIAVDGPANEQKGDGDAATWLPPNSDYDCRYVARQVAVKQKYHLWVTITEHAAMEKVLSTCPEQLLPALKD